MLYSFDIQYFEEPHQCDMVVAIIMDLPQAQLSDVKHNPFVIDVLNHAFMKAGIEKLSGHRTNLVDNLRVHSTGVPNTACDITCCYREKPGSNNYNSFSFKIVADVPPGYYFPCNHMVFNCAEDFEAYEKLYQSGRLVAAPLIPNSQTPIANGQYYILYIQQTVEMMRVVDASDPNNVRMEAIAADQSISPLTLSLSNRGQMRPIRLSDKLLSMMGFVFQTGNIYGLVGIDYFEGVLSCQGIPRIQVYLQRDRFGYSVIVPNVIAHFGCKLIKCFYLHELQDILLRELNVRIALSVPQLAAIAFFFTNVEFCCNIIETLPVEIETYIASQHPLAVSREQIVNHVAIHYGISEEQASHFMIFQYL